MYNFVQNGLTIGLSHERAVRRVLMFIILGLTASSLIMWQVNAQGYKEWLYAPFFLGLLLLLGKGTKPEVWSTAFLTGGAWSITQLTNPLVGGAQGLVWWITKGLPGVIVFWLCLTGFLATWSFEQSPGAFFPLVGFSILIFFALTAWDKWEGEWMFNIVLYYSIAIVLIALLKTTFLGDWVDWATDPQARQEARIEQEAEDRAQQIARKEAAQIAYEQELALAKAKNPAPKPILTSADYLTRQAGVFPQVTLDSTGIIVSDYQDSDLVYAISGGIGKFAVQYRGALTGPWTDATLVNGTEIKLKPGDNAWQYRFYTTRGTLKLDLERGEVPS